LRPLRRNTEHVYERKAQPLCGYQNRSSRGIRRRGDDPARAAFVPGRPGTGQDLRPLDLSAYLKPPSYEDLGERYDKLLTEGSVDAPDAPHGVLAYIELASAIVAGVLAGRYQEEGGIVSLERDLGYTLELLSRARNWINRLDLAARERDPVTALALERRRLQAEGKRRTTAALRISSAR
jgi:hypothetical protein